MAQTEKDLLLSKLDLIETAFLNLKANKELHRRNMKDLATFKSTKENFESLLSNSNPELKRDLKINDLIIVIKKLMKEIELIGNDVFKKKEDRPILVIKKQNGLFNSSKDLTHLN
jgi:hypothetical protein